VKVLREEFTFEADGGGGGSDVVQSEHKNTP
jgi:hypothetical protein